MAIYLNSLMAGLAILILHTFHRRLARRIPASLRHKCGRIATLWSRDIFFHLDFTISMHTDLDSTVRNHDRNGQTYFLDSLFGGDIVNTIAPENLQAVYTQGQDFGIQPARLPAMEYFCGRGFLTMDGEVWKKSRRMLKPTFAKGNISELGFLDRETRGMIEKIEVGETFDLQELLFVTFLNTSLHFLLGIDTSIEYTSAPCTASQFITAFHASTFGTGLRLMLSRLKFLSRFTTARRRAHAYIGFFIKQALTESENSGSYGTPNASRQSLIQSLASQTDDVVYVRSQILQGMMASQETTAVLIANTLFSLSRHPQYWARLRSLVLEQGEGLFTFDNLSKFEFLQNILRESLRLYPIFPLLNRSALHDTTLPVGGGINQDQPIFIPKGTIIEMSSYALHRNPDVFNPNLDIEEEEDMAVEVFNPERWSVITPKQWEYIPFGGGQRACLGREKVLAEAGFVVCRLAQRFERVESRDMEPWRGLQALTAKNMNGCKVAMYV